MDRSKLLTIGSPGAPASFSRSITWGLLVFIIRTQRANACSIPACLYPLPFRSCSAPCLVFVRACLRDSGGRNAFRSFYHLARSRVLAVWYLDCVGGKHITEYNLHTLFAHARPHVDTQ